MLLLSLLLLAAPEPDDGLAKKMLPIYVRDAAEYSMAVESGPKKALELKKEPVFAWSNPVREGLARVHHLLKGGAVDELHEDVLEAILLGDVVNRDNTRMR